METVGSRLGILCRLRKVHKAIIDVCPPFRPILSAIETTSYKLEDFYLPNSLQLCLMNLQCKILLLLVKKF